MLFNETLILNCTLQELLARNHSYFDYLFDRCEYSDHTDFASSRNKESRCETCPVAASQWKLLRVRWNRRL